MPRTFRGFHAETHTPCPTGPRFLFYCHDTFGLGHFRRTLALAAHFTSRLPGAEALIATGSPVAHAFTLPPRVDFIKFPAVTKLSNGTYQARSLSLGFPAIRDLRAALLRETAQAYRPDVFLVDHAPQGLANEALPTLGMLRAHQPECLRVLGLRDIIDERQVVRRSWTAEGVYQTLEEAYDLILVYGAQRVYDIAAEYAVPATVARRMRYCGYLDRLTETQGEETDQVAPATAAVGAELAPHDERLVVVTAGGGGDGFLLMQAYLLGLHGVAHLPFHSVLLTGPLMDANEQSTLRELARPLPPGMVRIEAFLPDPLPLLRAADLVVAMAGYNTVCELLALGQRTLLVPRATPRQEQLLRASVLTRFGLVHMLHPEALTAHSLAESVRHALAAPRPQARQLAAAGITFDGQARAARAIMAELGALRAQQRTTSGARARAS